MNEVPGWATPPSQCPSCKTQFNRAAELKGGTYPSPGDISVCIECGDVLHFGTKMQLCKLPSLDLLDDAQKKDVLQLQARIRKLRPASANQ